MRLAVSSWSFHRPLYAGTLHLADVPLAVFELGLRQVELNDRFLTSPQPGRVARLLGAKPAQTSAPDYGRKALRRVQQARLRSGTRVVCWTIDTDLVVSSAKAQQTQRAYLATAIEAARFLGAPILRLTLGGLAGERAALGRAIDLLRNALPVALASGVRLAIENHGGLSSEAGVLAEVIAAFPWTRDRVARPIGVCLDLGHFPEGEHIAGVTRLAPLAIHVHAPAQAFDEHGAETSIDYELSLKTLRAAGYEAAISIEYGGDDDPRTGILKTKALIEKYWVAQD
ncbi:MAG TPA: sugar phosphate isomerase/epimerase family protein [Anaerolineae bacterium]|nr:sugar phosphate isomerase/epimerase family protein [Anaerolineae bacterium]